ncbi:MAG: hypothetical protein JWQ79_893 [Mucilaginibacter sp.]|nr:hypothetical protein [Mucilaginibacter sp.]
MLFDIPLNIKYLLLDKGTVLYVTIKSNNNIIRLKPLPRLFLFINA